MKNLRSIFATEVEVDKETEAAVDYTANRLSEQFQGGHHGCSNEQHEEQLREHMEAAGENHDALDEIFHDRRLVLAFRSEAIMSAIELGLQRLPTAEQWEAMVCGLPKGEQQRLPMNICLHKEETQAVEPAGAFDVDSFLAFPSSLAVFKQGLLHQPAAQATQNIQTSVHVGMNAFNTALGEDATIGLAKKCFVM